MQYINKMPLPEKKYGDLPPYMKKYYDTDALAITSAYIQKLIDWAEREFFDVKNYYLAMGNARAIKLFMTHDITFINVIANSKAFEIIRTNITNKDWEALPKAYQIVLGKASKIAGF